MKAINHAFTQYMNIYLFTILIELNVKVKVKVKFALEQATKS